MIQAISVNNKVLLPRWESERVLTLHTDLLQVAPDEGVVEKTEKAPDSKFAVGSYSWDIVFQKPPAESKFSFGIDFPEMRLTRQPFLTEEDWSYIKEPIEVTPYEVRRISDGKVLAFISPEMAGSYVIYDTRCSNIWHKSRNAALKYRNYKVGVIPRPYLIDAKGNRCWCEMTFRDGQLDVVCDPLWLKTAVYPVRLDPEFGYTTDPTGTSYTIENQIYGSTAACSEAGTGTSIDAYLINATEAKDFKCALYETDGDLVTNGQTAQAECPVATGWQTVNFASGPILAAATYVLVAWGESAGGNFYIGQDRNAGFDRYGQALAYDANFPNPATFSTAGTYQFGIHCNYSTGGGGISMPLVMLQHDHFGGGQIL